MKTKEEIKQKLLELGYQQAIIDSNNVEKRKQLVESINLLLWVLD